MDSTIGTHDLANRWQSCVRDWIRHVRSSREFVRSQWLDPIVKMLCGDVSNKHVLDLGCGEGRFSRHLASEGANVTGVDIVPEFIEEAITTGPASIRYIAADMQHMRQLDQVFQLCVAYLSLNSLPDLRPTLQVAANCCSPGGVLVVVLPHPCFMAPVGNSDYFEECAYEERFGPETESVVLNYHRPLTTVVESGITTGWSVRQIHEPAMPKGVRDNYAQDIDQIRSWRNLPDPFHFPWFVCMSFTRI